MAAGTAGRVAGGAASVAASVRERREPALGPLLLSEVRSMLAEEGALRLLLQ